jgi:next-to-BRCA1 protein 1
MASPNQPHVPGPVNQDTLITLKIVIDGNNRRFKLALRDLGANVLPQKVRLYIISIRFSPVGRSFFALP